MHSVIALSLLASAAFAVAQTKPDAWSRWDGGT